MRTPRRRSPVSLGKASAVLPCAVLGGLGVALVDLASTLPSWAPVGPSLLAAAGLGAAVGALGGTLGALVLRLVRARPHPPAPSPMRRGGEAARHARISAAVVAFALFIAGLDRLLLSLRTVQDEGLAATLTLVGATGLAVVLLGAALGSLAPLTRAFARLERRLGLPWPASAGARRVLFVAMPLAALTAVLIALLTKALGPFVAPLWLVLVAAVAIGLHPLLAALASRSPRAAGFAPAAALALALGLGAGAHVTLTRDPAVASAVQRSGGVALALGALRGLSDWDRDGASSLFGGGDCAPFDAALRPTARDVPGDGVDQDCDGGDALVRAAEPAAYHGGVSVPDEGRPNVLWIIIDAVRADSVGWLGRSPSPTPYLDALAAESLVFEEATSQSSATMLSIPSMLVGKTPLRMRWVPEKGKLQPDASETPLATRLRSAGYQTGLVAGEYFRGNLPQIARGYDFVRYFTANQERSTPEGASAALGFLSSAVGAQAPFFLTLYLPAPHAPYVPHEEGYPSFGEGNEGLYRGEIAAADRYVGLVLDHLRAQRSAWKKTLVVVVADHGEEFGEHGGSEHARTCHGESVRVPLLLRVPGLSPARVASPVSLVDVLPTLVELAGLPRPPDGELDGASLLLPALAPERARERPSLCGVISQRTTQGHFYRRSLRAGGFALLEDVTAGTVELYDTAEDPGETRPLPPGGERGQLREELLRTLHDGATGNLGEVLLTGP